jgi:tetratricopeptide (TPR) repeat protein
MAIDKRILERLAFQFSQARPILFTGAGFSLGTKDVAGALLPSGEGFANELWKLCFGDDAREADSHLADLFHAAHTRKRTELTDLLRRRFTIDPSSLGDHFRLWFSMPWKRIYTLNVDNLASAASLRFTLPRRLTPRSACRPEDQHHAPSQGVDVVHLNGLAEHGPDGVTFSVRQYSERLTAQDPWYAQLSAELLSYTVVFVGTPLEESTLWQHIEYRGSKTPRSRELRPHSYLVSPRISRARAALLDELNVEWVQMTGEQFALEVLAQLGEAAEAGLAKCAASVAAPDNAVSDVAALLAKHTRRSTSLFLMGDDPQWDDISQGRAIDRDCDAGLLSQARALSEPRLRGEGAGTPAACLVVTGTAGSGKSTSLTRLAARLSADGVLTLWVDKTSDATAAHVRNLVLNMAARSIVVIDDIDRFGTEANTLIWELTHDENVGLLLIGLRASKVDRVINAARLPDVPLVEVSLPHLADGDIGKLLDVLTRENRLGMLRGKARSEQEKAFAEKAGRQLLVAMIEATSGRRFEEKVVDEWRELTGLSQEVYALLALASMFRYSMTREDILLATNNQTNEMLNGIDSLARRGVAVTGNDGRLRARHKLIAECLIDELRKEGRSLVNLYSSLAFMASTQVGPNTPRKSRVFAFLKSLINHAPLLRALELEGARRVYEELEQTLNWDYHYWLQRGSLEVEAGSADLADNFLSQAIALQPADPYVVTAYAYMLMRKARANPGAPQAQGYLNEALESLRSQISTRGHFDYYPFHVLGSQVLAWVRKANLGRDDKRRLLRQALGDVDAGLRKHPRNRDLATLRRDLEQEYHSAAL